MAKNLHRVLTSYVAVPCVVDHPAKPTSGSPCRVGKMVGFALVDEQFGYESGDRWETKGMLVNKPVDIINGGQYDNGETPVSFQMNEWKAKVRNAHASEGAVVGDPVFYYDTAQGTGVNASNLVVKSSTGTKTGLLGVLREPIAANSTATVVVMVIPQGDADLT